ncbi:MAG: response regulator [Burkholderiaceae bacterium]
MSASEVCTTQRAAEILGISVTSVQHLVESGVIEAWKTKGGHRRIPIEAVQAYKASPATPHDINASAISPKSDKKISVLIIEDNQMQREIYNKQIASWNLPVQLTFCENGYQGLMKIASHKPDILLADIVMEGIDGYEVINTVLGHPDLADMHIAILSNLTPQDMETRGGVPDGVVFFSKPINYDELRGYLRACCAQKVRHHHAVQA